MFSSRRIGMRITNKIIQNNNLANINTNKIYQDTLSTQMSTQKKINRPSDDPVVAIRALRLRSNVTEVTQYYSKNIPDAESWLDVTEDSLNNLTSVITNIISQCTKGANGDLTTSDRQVILEQLKALGEEVYSTADADYAGRYVFTGYRTDTSLRFDNEETLKTNITEQLSKDDIDQLTIVNTRTAAGDDLQSINKVNYANVNVAAVDVQSTDVYRIRLAYNNCDDQMPVLSYPEQVTDANGEISLNWKTITTEVVPEFNTNPSPAQRVQEATKNGEEVAIFVPETGEMYLSDAAYDRLMNLEDDTKTSTLNEAEIRVSYQKSEWTKGDLRPQHYFACSTTDADGKVIDYNQSYLNGITEKQVIEYDVGFNQTIRVNSTADECFKHGIGRTVDDMVQAMKEVAEIQKIMDDLEDLKKTVTGADLETVESRLLAVGKAYDLLKDKAQRMFETGITTMQGYLDEANLSITNCGTRSSKLELIKNRMQTQKTTFETLKSENEDVDITDVAIQLSSAQLTYEAALMATGKVTQTSLLNYI